MLTKRMWYSEVWWSYIKNSIFVNGPVNNVWGDMTGGHHSARVVADWENDLLSTLQNGAWGSGKHFFSWQATDRLVSCQSEFEMGFLPVILCQDFFFKFSVVHEPTHVVAASDCTPKRWFQLWEICNYIDCMKMCNCPSKPNFPFV